MENCLHSPCSCRLPPLAPGKVIPGFEGVYAENEPDGYVAWRREGPGDKLHLQKERVRFQPLAHQSSCRSLFSYSSGSQPS